MAILPALQSAAIRLIGQKPTTFYGAAGTFEMEICDLANEVAQDVAKYRDWQALVRFATITGDGATEVFDLPADYDRQMLVSDLQDTQSPFWGYRRVLDVNAFNMLVNGAFTPLPGAWTIYANQLRFAPAPADAVSATYPYISKHLAVDTSGLQKEAFTNDADSFVLPERLLTLGLVWRWRENKKLDSTGDMDAFTKALEEYAAKDGGSRPIRRNARRGYPGTYPAWPFELG